MQAARVCLLVFLLTARAVSAGAQSTGWTSSRTVSHRFDFGTATADPDRFGVHYDLKYEFSRARNDPQGHHFGIAATASGFEDIRRDESALSVVHLEAALVGRYYRAGDPAPLNPEHQKRMLDLLSIERTELGAAENAELDALVRRVTQNRRFLSYDGHYRYEYSRITDASQNVLGLAVSGELPMVHRLLGVLAEITGTSARYRQQPVRFYVSTDYVNANRIIGDDHPRIRGQLAWSTLLLDAFVFRATYHADYLVDASHLTATHDFNHVFQGWIVLPLLSQEAGLMLKYTAGRFAPDYRKADDLHLGLTVALQ